jgi:high-affinity Fe2+/Pb2+ permease
LSPGGKLFEASFGLSYGLGLFLTAGVVVAYTLFGGFLAVSLTDFVQGCIMFIALIMVPAGGHHPARRSGGDRYRSPASIRDNSAGSRA